MELPIAHLLMVLSGAAALAWQMVWTAEFGAAMGHEIVAVLAVLAAFFGGLAMGAQMLGRTLARSRWPGRWYAGCELLLLAWGLALTVTMPSLIDATARLIGPEPSVLRHWTVAFLFPFLLLLPASAAMGATLPALERQLSTARSRLGGLYAANTFGAVLGLLLAVFVLMPHVGLLRTALFCAAANALCAVLAWWLWRNAPVTPITVADRPMPSTAGRRVPALLVATGVLGIGYEVLAVRVLSQVTESTVYSYALLLAMYLLGTAAGAAIYQRLAHRAGDPRQLRDRLLLALATTVLLSGLALGGADALCAWPARWMGPGAAGALAGEALAAAAAMGAPTLVMGALFTHLCIEAQSGGLPLGRALALNTAGAALAPALVGVWLIPALGAPAGLALMVAGYLLLQSPVRWRRPQTVAIAAMAGATLLWGASLRFVDVPDGGRVLSYDDGVMAAVSVVADADGVARLRINNRAQEGSSASGLVEWRLAQLPLLLHTTPPRQALFLGLGTGFTAAAAAQEPGLQVHAVELLPEVIAAAALFAKSPAAPVPLQPLHTVSADARRFVQASDAHYDVIVADLFHPARSGAGALYTVEQFAAVRARLAPGGVFCQWLALHQMDLDTLRSIVAAFLAVYPDAIAVMASNSLDTPVLGLIARPDDPAIDLAAVRTRLAQSAGPSQQAAARLEDEFAVVGSVLAGPTTLARFARGATANTDDRPVVVHQAPWATYAPPSTPRERLMQLLGELQPHATELLRQPRDAEADRMQAYWAARRLYLAFGATVRPVADPGEMLRRVQKPLMGLLRQSPEFRPACEPLVAMANALRGSDPARAEAVTAALDGIGARCAHAARTTAPAS
ncbi:fused MFS/spermidine synthase [Variovorax arabinosiphilus]|uniref:fused MFS/spermidine synthase n=1 Tax=Variovorax arabinosiphilus TaxID=3053498 RepID=UPI00257621C8|nr:MULTISPECIES: fused MFS/spermidine synthase [unclassified Variovorax]MDM0119399.1 fused MFS/spermidine synthase [Variovorax sp. J2L1-78]MDM0129825.1 fused MFS/spermidine synthase [Variovorax sp. J2L1-63]MDM0232389.1 fused MFS/spermidine synthase [Variovorax sp. J2R1-6]